MVHTVSSASIRTAAERISLRELPQHAYEQLAAYLRLLYRWNSRINLTAVRDPDEMISLHLPECLLAAELLPPGTSSLLDYGSGGGLPGVPIAVARPEIRITLAEAQKRKAAFLREVSRELQLERMEVFSQRAQELKPGTVFDVVTLRAVDRMETAIGSGAAFVSPAGCLLILTSIDRAAQVRAAVPDVRWTQTSVPGTIRRVILRSEPPAPPKDEKSR